MPVPEEGPRPLTGRVGIVASRFNETVSAKLLAGAQACLAERGVPTSRVDLRWVPGAWELPVMVRALLARGGYDAVVAVGAVIRGETAHFDYIAGEASRGLMALAVEYGVPVGFGLLTCDTMAQALARAGGAAGNKGFEAMAAALDVAARLPRRDADPR
ncbi:MAG: 6,7-dimethyl-8-ribityllumazine synthase [Gemmatimonadetes bacterium]|nr:6,7-dimethyl-8-ribityllumazine synthase [Gemmatimonadota bacterium]